MSGFTLLEVLLVLAVVGIVACIASFSLADILPGYQLKSAAGELFGTMQRGRAEAIKRGRSCVISFDLSNSEYRLFLDNSTPANNSFDPGDEILAAVSLLSSDRVRLVSSTFGNNSAGLPALVFTRRGFLERPNGVGIGNGSVLLQNSRGETRTITTVRSGRITVQ